MSAVIGQKAPNLGVSEWIQGTPTNLDQEKDKVVLVEHLLTSIDMLILAKYCITYSKVK
jgi:hypothetical protein